MDLDDLVKAGIGFGVGLYWALTWNAWRKGEELDIRESIDVDVDKRFAKRQRYSIKGFKLLLPFMGGFAYQFFNLKLNPDHVDISGQILMTLGCYFGQFVGNNVRRTWSMTNALVQVLRNPYDYEQHLLKPKQRVAVQAIYQQLREEILGGGQDTIQYRNKIGDLLNRHRLRRLVLELSIHKTTYIMDHSELHRLIRNYYERGNYTPSIEVRQDSNKIKAYTRIGDNLFIDKVTIGNARIRVDTQLQLANIAISENGFKEGRRLKWTGDYHELAERAYASRSQYQVIFSNMKPGTDMEDRKKHVMCAIATSFVPWMRTTL